MIEIKKAIWVEKEFHTEGHQPLLVVTEDGDKYVAKSGKGKYPPISLINEFLCSFLLSHWGIKTPEFAAILVDPKLVDFRLSPVNRLDYYASHCFGSKWIPEAIEVNTLIGTKSNWQFNKFEKPLGLWMIGLFDMWVENDDRKPSNPNLMLKEAGNAWRFDIYAIDHAFTFMSASYEILKPSYGVTQSANDSILDSDLLKFLRRHLSPAKIAQIRDDFFGYIAICKSSYSKFASQIPIEFGFTEVMQDLIHAFLFDEDRNIEVFEEFLRRI